nr:S8 family serine peptidase [Halobiforma lacisalsi]
MVTSAPAMAFAGASGGTQTEAAINDERTNVSPAVDETVLDRDEPFEMVLRFESADVSDSMTEAEAVSALQAHAERTQSDALSWIERTDGVEYRNDFWLANAVLVEVEPSTVGPKRIAEATGAESVHANFEVSTLDGENASESDAEADDTADRDAEADTAGSINAAENVTYGLEMINAPDVWEEYDTKGEGAGVAVLDTGLDADHPDHEIAPENWQQFDGSGEPIETEPNDGNGHGTHVSGTVVGPEDPAGDVPAYGVAPEAELYHGKVLEDDGSGTFAQIVAGMEWAVDDTDADVVTMSLGVDGYESEMVEPSENARDAGVVLVASAGNSGQGVSGAPGNVYPNFASGAVDENGEVAGFSSGELIETDGAYPDAPEYWPDEYVVPNAAAPGVDVLSSVPGGGYDGTFSGTSMSAPHKAGTFALLVSASDGEADRELLYEAVETTAWQPDGVEEEPNTEYGHGIIDAAAAADLVALDSGVEGTVTDADGTPIGGAVVELDDRSTETDESGAYSHVAAPGEYTVTADAFGYESVSADVTVEENETTEQDFELGDALDVELASGQPDGVEGGQTIEATVTAANAESITVDLAGDYDEADATLFVDGEEATFGEEVDLGGPVSGDLTVAVETTEDTEGELSLEHTIAGLNDEITVTTGPTTVFEDFVPVAVVDDAGAHGSDVADVLDATLSPMYNPEVTTSEEAMDGYDVVVVQNIDPAAAEAFAEATGDRDTGVVYLDQWGVDSNGIPEHSEATGEPDATYQDDLAAPPIGYELTADHEIFEGIGEAGETVELHDALFGDHTWFEGTEYDVLAETTTGDGVTAGSGFAVDDRSATVFASSLGYTTFVGSDDYTDEADAILANAVEYVVPEPAPNFQLEVLGTNEPIIEGENLTVDVAVENDGVEPGTQTVTLGNFDGDVVDDATVDLEDGESTVVSLTWETDETDVGTGNVTVASEDDAIDYELTVHEEPDGLLTFGDGDHVGTVEGTVDVEIATTADAVAGYETQVRFDPDVLQVERVEGGDLGEPMTGIDNENGTLSLAQAQGQDANASTLAVVEFAIVDDAPEGGTELVFDEENTYLNAEDGDLDILPVDGTVETAWLGDVNADGELNTYDATLTQQFIAGEEPTDTFHAELADMNGNGQVDAGDVTMMLEEIVASHGADALEA